MGGRGWAGLSPAHPGGGGGGWSLDLPAQQSVDVPGRHQREGELLDCMWEDREVRVEQQRVNDGENVADMNMFGGNVLKIIITSGPQLLLD